MGKPLQDAAAEGMFLGYTIKKAGVAVVIVVLALALLASAVANIVIQRSTIKLAAQMATVGADRWTATDQAAFVKEHDTGVDVLVETKMGEINGTFDELSEAIQEMRETLAVDHERLKNMERQLNRIESKVFNGSYKPGGGG